MNMTPRIIVIGSLLILGVIVFMVVVVPYATRIEAPSDIFRSRTIRETDGRSIYIANGCSGQTHFARLGTNRSGSFPGRRGASG